MSELCNTIFESNAICLGGVDLSEPQAFPLFMASLSAGTPSPNVDDIDTLIDLNDLCVRHPMDTVLYRTGGVSMIGAGINDGDYLVVDKSIEVKSGMIVAADYFGECLVKELQLENDNIRLLAHNDDYADLDIEYPEYFSIVGVVTWVFSCKLPMIAR
ncbi:LexA family protein [Acinetobacter sp. c3-l95]|uniref:LexA family protein n=1 Tax=Acinetobacter sp. c3-l95 TaxID=3342804 RepID=UPI0035BAAF00